MHCDGHLGEGTIEFLLEVLLQVLIEIIGELVFEFGWESVSESFRDRPKANPVIAGFGYLLLGSVLGLVLSWFYPVPFSKHEGVTILGVFLNPLGFGLLSYFYGESRRRRAHTTTNLATFWGGVAFAFGMSLSRAVVVLP